MKEFRYKGYNVKISDSDVPGEFQWDYSDDAGDVDGCDGYLSQDAAAKGAMYAINRDIERQEMASGDYK